MDVRRRLQMIRIIEKIDNNPTFSKKIGIENKSHLIKIDNDVQKEVEKK